MLNEERVKLMVQLASYEQKEGKEDFKVSSYSVSYTHLTLPTT